ncbi:addiction module toxin RelE [Citrobacter pasteurii]|uniref:Addiction module toxin RelE n=1 Tax=Citrobacter pasteurii TaxID=1563222 RepID=A0A6N6KB92_9ENTR|nr:addiction module toxin RelE [Citrobacter pasteurii]
MFQNHKVQYAKSFKLHQGSKRVNPQELTQVSDRGERTSLT